MDRNLDVNNDESYILSLKEKRDFFNSFFVYYKSGIPIVDSIKKIANKNTSPKIKSVADDMYRDLSKGQTFEAVMRRQESIFGKVITGLLISGEQSGKLIVVLSRIQTLIQKENHFKNKIISAITYPAIIFMLMIFVSCLFLFFVFPKIDGGSEVNIFLLVISAIIKTIIVYAVIIFGFVFVKKNHIIDKKLVPVLMRIPKVSDIVNNAALANFFLVLSVAYDGGLSATTMLDLASETIKQSKIKNKMKKAVKNIIDGDDISTALTKVDALNENYIAAIATGETTGELDKALNDIVEEIDETTDVAIRAFGEAFKVLIMIIAGIGVLILLAIFYSKLTKSYLNMF